MMAFGYLRRVSWLENPQNAAWLEAQRLAIRRFCRKKRIDLQGFFEDEGNPRVSALEKLTAALEKEEADCAVICGDYEGARSFNIDQLEKSARIRFFPQRPAPLLLQETF